MKIFIESSPLNYNLTGVGQFTRYIIEALVDGDNSNEYILFNLIEKTPTWRSVIGPKPNISYETLFKSKAASFLYRAIRRFIYSPPIDLFFSSSTKNSIFFFPNFVQWPLLGKNTKPIIVIHDLGFIYHPQYCTKGTQHYLGNNLDYSVKNSAHIIAVSENTKKEILEHYKINESKVSVINSSISHAVFNAIPQQGDEKIINHYQLTKPYILFTGTIEPRKNIIGLLNAYEKLPNKLQQEYNLVLVGGKGWLDQEIHQKLNDLKHLNIKCIGYVPDEHLPAIYRHANLFVFPSFYEGFGIPPLEAMACGVPVICSNTSSLPEVVGSAGLLVDPHQPEQLSEAICSVLNDTDLAASMRSRGLLQAQQFSWKKSAQQLLHVFQTIASKAS